jgi:predicted regulator of Ras-like GTPase activity (Roadblock/LC7/MglB family)
LVIIPLLFYPKRLGFPPFDLNPSLGLLEWAFYVAVLSISTARLSFSTRIVAGGFTVIYRLLIAVATGSVVCIAHSLPWGNSVNEMLWSYPLALIPQVLAAAVTLAPLWEQVFVGAPAAGGRRVRLAPPPARVIVSSASGVVPAAASASRIAAAASVKPFDPSFDDAVAYVGDYHGVRMCWIVDGDGLPVAVWQRQQYTKDADFWAPMSVEMVDFHRRALSDANSTCVPDRLELRTKDGKVIVEAVEGFWLGVLTEPDTDELISVRIARARDMIARHWQEKSGQQVAAVEARYV